MDISALGIAVTATVGLVEVLKQTGLNSKWSPLVSLVVGFGMTFLFTHQVSISTAEIGILTGLAASGAYSGVKSVVSPSSQA